MDCREVCEKIYDYIEHQLSQEELKEFEEHMKGCKHCQDEYYELEKVIVRLKNVKDIEPPKYLKDKILENIKKEEKQVSKILYFKKYSYVAATIAIFICGFYVIKAIENSTIKNNVYNVKIIEKSTEDITETTSDLTMKIKGRELNIEPSTEAITLEETINKETIEQTKDVIAQKDENVSRIASRSVEDVSGDQQTQAINEIENTSESAQYFYQKDITQDMYVKSFKHDIALYKEQICSVYFENDADEDVMLYIEDIDGNKVSQDVIVNKKSNSTMEFYMTDEDREQDVYTINVKSTNLNLQGYLKVEVLFKE